MSSTLTLPPTLHWRPLPAPLPSTSSPAAHAVLQTPGRTTPVPCRRCLRDIAPGEPAVLLSYDPFLDHDTAGNSSPYRHATAIYAHADEDGKNACRLADVRRDFGGMVPEQQVGRTLAVRGYDGAGMMVGWGVVEGEGVVGACEGLLLGEEEEEGGKGRAEYVHLYYDGPGCFAVRVERSG